MRTIVSVIRVNKYSVLTLDGPVPARNYRKYRIDGVDYNIVPVYDLPNNIAIAEDGDFKGKTVEFI